jgi:hypothetical protein
MKMKVKLPILYGLLAGAGLSVHAVTVHDLTAPGTDSANVAGVVGGTAIFSDFFSQPTGTGVFQPFTDSQAKQNGPSGSKYIEQGYNSDGQTYLDAARKPWNHLLKLGDLAKVNVSGREYYAFVLDSNEQGNRGDNLISLDNIRIYTSSTDTAASAQAGGSDLANLGTLRWALNNAPTAVDGPFNVDTWIKLDSNQENTVNGKSNGGSGKADLIAYIPTAAFAGAQSTDYLWFYNLMGVNENADAGFEEWSALKGPQNFPDGGATAMLLGASFLGLAALRKTKK